MSINKLPFSSDKHYLSAHIINPRPEHIAGLRQLWKEAFGDTDAFLDVFFSTAFSPERCLCVLIENKIAAALYWFECEYQNQPLAYIYAVATAVAYRGNGLCRQLLDAVHYKLQKQGYIGALLVPGSETLFDFYKKLGYQTTCYRHTYKYNLFKPTNVLCKQEQQSDTTDRATANRFSLNLISSFEYATLRRQFLPANSVIQEKENLSFLQTQLGFYSGEHFLLAAHIDNQTLYGTELLLKDSCDATALTSKNTLPKNVFPQALANQLLSYFDCTNGIIYTPGQDTAFAMYYPLNDNQMATPNYFAFAFD